MSFFSRAAVEMVVDEQPISVAEQVQNIMKRLHCELGKEAAASEHSSSEEEEDEEELLPRKWGSWNSTTWPDSETMSAAGAPSSSPFLRQQQHAALRQPDAVQELFDRLQTRLMPMEQTLAKLQRENCKLMEELEFVSRESVREDRAELVRLRQEMKQALTLLKRLQEKIDLNNELENEAALLNKKSQLGIEVLQPPPPRARPSSDLAEESRKLRLVREAHQREMWRRESELRSERARLNLERMELARRYHKFQALNEELLEEKEDLECRLNGSVHSLQRLAEHVNDLREGLYNWEDFRLLSRNCHFKNYLRWTQAEIDVLFGHIGFGDDDQGGDQQDDE